MNSATSRLPPRPQTIPGGYEPPENFLEVDVVNPETHGIGSKKYTDYEIKVRVCFLHQFDPHLRLNKRVFMAGLFFILVLMAYLFNSLYGNQV